MYSQQQIIARAGRDEWMGDTKEETGGGGNAIRKQAITRTPKTNNAPAANAALGGDRNTSRDVTNRHGGDGGRRGWCENDSLARLQCVLTAYTGCLLVSVRLCEGSTGKPTRWDDATTTRRMNTQRQRSNDETRSRVYQNGRKITT